MFSNRIANSAKFLQMPSESQLLYFHLILRADDDGVVESYPITKLLGLAPDNLRVLQARGFIRELNEDQVVVITDWLEHNVIRADRKVDSIYKHLLPPDIKTLEAKVRSDRPEQNPENRTKLLGRPNEIDNGTVMGRHKLSQVKLSKVNRESKFPPEYLKKLPKEDIQEFSNLYKCGGDQVIEMAEKILLYCDSKGVKYKNYKATLQQWLLKEFGKRFKKGTDFRIVVDEVNRIAKKISI